MKVRNIHIGWWLGSMLTLLCAACGGGDEGSDTPAPPSGPQLEIHVFTPERPMVTRSDIGDVEAEAAEKELHSMSIWVFQHSDGSPVGYLSPSKEALPTTQSRTYRLTVTDAFAEAKPNVDIFVMANVTTSNTGITLGPNSSREDLQAAMIQHSETASTDYFGLISLQSTVPADGLPMSGVLLDQPVDGLAPVLSVSTNVKVARAVSKVRFVFSMSKSSEGDTKTLTIDNITLSEGMIPSSEYLYLDGPYTGRNTHVYGTNNYEPSKEMARNVSVISCQDPGKYAYAGQSGQDYENLIKSGIGGDTPELTSVGPFYLRESDKKVSGTIYYTIGSGTQKNISFSLSEAGDFSRNHSWIVYGYFVGDNILEVNRLKIDDWTNTDDGSHEVYNW